jgi:hypothetical protein
MVTKIKSWFSDSYTLGKLDFRYVRYLYTICFKDILRQYVSQSYKTKEKKCWILSSFYATKLYIV